MVAGAGWAASQRLEGLVEAFDFAAGGRVVRSRVLLDDTEAVEEVFEAVAAALAAGQAGGEDHPVVGQRGGRDTVVFAGRCVNVSTTIGPVTRRWAVTEMA